LRFTSSLLSAHIVFVRYNLSKQLDSGRNETSAPLAPAASGVPGAFVADFCWIARARDVT